MTVKIIRTAPSYSAGHFMPPADNLYDLGSVALSWRNIYFETAIYGGSVAGDFHPSADNTYSLGTQTGPKRWLNGIFSGNVVIGGGASASPAPDTLLHIWKASAGAVAAAAASLLTLENNDDVGLQFLSPATKMNSIYFGSPTAAGRGTIDYNHNTDVMGFGTASNYRLKLSAGAFAFQEATNITSTGKLGLQTGTAQDIDCWATTGTGRTLYLSGTTSSGAGDVKDSPTLQFTAWYRDGAVQNSAWVYTILHDMITGGANPKSQAIHSINSLAILTLENNNTVLSVLLGASKLGFTGECLYDEGSNILALRNNADSNYADLHMGYLRSQYGIVFYATGYGISNPNSDDAFITWSARDNGVGLVEVMRVVGAADPYVKFTLPPVLTPIATASLPVAPQEGAICYDNTLNKMRVYNGAAWETVTSV